MFDAKTRGKLTNVLIAFLFGEKINLVTYNQFLFGSKFWRVSLLFTTNGLVVFHRVRAIFWQNVE